MTVDTPAPFRLSDVIAYIDEQLGKLERTRLTLAYRRLKARIESLISDQRYNFMFGSITVQDTMADILGRLFRVPTEGRPITVIDLSTVPPEILDVVISVISRLAFDLARVEQRADCRCCWSAKRRTAMRPPAQTRQFRPDAPGARAHRQGRAQVRHLAGAGDASGRPSSIPPSCPSAAP